MTTPVNVAVIYYSSTGTTHDMAERLSQTAEKAGAEVRLVRAAELAPEGAHVVVQRLSREARAQRQVEPAEKQRRGTDVGCRDLDTLRRDVDAWFEPHALDRILGKR